MSDSIFYKQIELPHPISLDSDLILANGTLFHNVEAEDSATLKSYLVKNRNFIKKLVSNIFKFHIQPDYLGYVEITFETGNIHPHTDVHQYGLNIILEDQGAVTKFWTTTEKCDTTIPSALIYDINKCQLIGEFKATAGSAWLYDLHTIHSVHNVNSTGKRKIITVRWRGENITFDQLYNSIEVL
jgi:hypothetical protein